MLAGIDIDAIAVSAGAANGEIPKADVFAIRGMNRPHQAIVGREILEAEIIAADRFDQRGMAQRILRIRPAAERRVANDLAWADNPDMIGVNRVNQADAPLYPFPFPANLRDRIIGKIGRSDDCGVLVEPQNRVGLKRDGAREIGTGRNQHFASAENRASIDGLLDRGRILGRAVARRAKIADVQRELGFRGPLSESETSERRDRRSREHALPGSLQKAPSCDFSESSHCNSYRIVTNENVRRKRQPLKLLEKSATNNPAIIPGMSWRNICLFAAYLSAAFAQQTAGTDPEYRKLRDAQPSESFVVENLVLHRDAGAFTLKTGTVSFAPPVLGRVTLGVFVGEGEFVLTPAIWYERNHLGAAIGEGSVRETFDRAVFVFTDDSYQEIKGTAKTRQAAPEASDALRDVRQLLRRRPEPVRSLVEDIVWSEQMDNVEADVLTDLYNPQRPGFFSAYIHGKKYNDLRFHVRSRGGLPTLDGP